MLVIAVLLLTACIHVISLLTLLGVLLVVGLHIVDLTQQNHRPKCSKCTVEHITQQHME